MEPQRKVAFDNLFAAVTTRISRSSLSLKVSDLHSPILNRLKGCIYFGTSGNRNCNLSTIQSTSPSSSILGKDIFSDFFGKDNLPEMDIISKKTVKEFSSESNIHSISKSTLNLLQKSLIAQGGNKNFEEALIFAEQSRNMELTRIAPAAIYGMLNYKAIASNPAYSKFLRAIPFSKIDLKTIRKIALREQATIVYYSTVASDDDKKLFVWVVQPSGDIIFKEIDISSLGTSLKAVVDSTSMAASSFVNRGRQTTSRIQAVRSLRSQSYERQRKSVEDFFIDESTQAQRLQYLHKLLIKPIENLLPKNPESDVIFVPQGDLTVVPFAALRDADGSYLVEKHTIRTAYSFANLKRPIKRIKQMPKGKKEVLMVGNPNAPNLTYNDGSVQVLPQLPYAQTEAVEISNSLSGHWFIKEAASLENIASLLPEAKIIHFAAHGLLNHTSHREFMLIQRLEGNKNNSLHIEQPVANGLVDSGLVYKVWYDQKSPETRWQVIQAKLSLPGAIALAGPLLTAEQILSMRLKADLVVLSACNTAQGVNTESGVLGLPFAFGLAGVPRATVALWSVPDESTKLLMSEFYSAMSRNAHSSKDANPAKSLREAMLKVKDQEQFSDPIHWAGFTVMDVSY